jgi:hypothetical protein
MAFLREGRRIKTKSCLPFYQRLQTPQAKITRRGPPPGTPHANDKLIREWVGQMASYCIVSLTLTLLLLVAVGEASAQNAPPSKPFERFNGCVLEPDEWTDGDSFRVRLPDGRLETFRLYFVDTTESRSRASARTSRQLISD